MVEAANEQLTAHADFVNSLNVFPVPDGDTGTNMSLSFQTGVERVRGAKETRIDELTQVLAKGLLLGARGNSGVILSQLFRGFAKGCEGEETLDAKDFSRALNEGVKVAYRAVMKPVEGTLLTVARESAEAGEAYANTSDDLLGLMETVYHAAEQSLKETPEHLKVLKEVGVVDSGGQGLVFIYNGFLEALSGKSINIKTQSVENLDLKEMAHEENYYNTSHSVTSEDIKYGYCTQMLIRLGDGPTAEEEFDYDEFREHLNGMGDSLIVVNDDEFVKVHVHTEHPGLALDYGQRFGSLTTVKVDNMRGQHDTILENQGKEAPKPVPQPTEKQPFGIVAVAAGDGVQELFQGAGATTVINGGQTMNPSTEDIVKAIEAINADNIILLPNNKNIFMASEQAAEVVDQPTIVVHTSSVSEGLTALLGYNPTASLEENGEAMEEERQNVTSGQVTHAIRDTEIDGLTIKEGDYMGIVDGDIKVSDSDLADATVKMVDAMLDEDSEIVTVIYGDEQTEDDANQIIERLQEKHDDIEFEVYYGGQPVYNYFVSVE
ncbi:MAG: DAK2 domain-containing protein [Aerococcus sp.]|nr:DAK2 domain-containing protein [Aerococcus sp.]